MQSFEATTALSMTEAEAAVRSSLAEQGFGVLTEIDVAANLRAALGIERRPLKLLGACNPNFANEALDLDADVSLLMPCNVVLTTTDVGTRITAVDPRALISEPEFAALTQDAADRLRAALAAIPAS